jgi:RNA polymerase sigma-70 factor (ECF subfamily)
MISDEALMARVAAGESAALAELYRRWSTPLHRFLVRATSGRDAEDLQQETWLRVVRAADRFDPGRRFSTWLFQIALNLTRDWRRRPPPEPADPTTLEMPGTDARPATDAGLDAERLLAALPAPQREAVVLRYCQDLSEDEVAAILGCPRGTVKSRLHHAMKKLVSLVREPERSSAGTEGGDAV